MASPAAIEAIKGALTDAMQLDPNVADATTKMAALVDLQLIETQVRAMQADWLGAIDRTDATVEEAGRATRSWLIEDQHLARRDAAKRVNLARWLPTHPHVETAFRAGGVTAEQASVILTGLLTVPADIREVVEKELVRLADDDGFTPRHLAQSVEAVCEQLGVDDSAAARRERRHAQRSVQLAPSWQGTGVLNGTLTAEVYEALRLALDAAGATAPGDREDERPGWQCRHDALGVVATFYLTHADELPASNGERPRVTVTTTRLALLAAGVDTLGSDAWAVSDAGLPVPPETARRLACDAQLLPIDVDADGQPLAVGRTTRSWPAHIRRAAWIRDHGRCTFPRCARPPADLHHIVWWSHGGTTSLDNSAWLCAFHHWLVHEGGWTLGRDETTSELTFINTKARRRVANAPP